MTNDCRGVKSTPFETNDLQFKALRAPVVLSEGTGNGTALGLPSAGIRCCFTQKTGAIADSGSLAGKIQESPDGSNNWVDLVSFAAAGANDTQHKYATTTQPYVRHVGVVTGGGAGTVATDAGVLY